jgi:predicted ATP-grasp superfamily ATP-dependent carboligase
MGQVKAKAFVLNVSTPNGLGVIRSLGREGIPVIAVDSRRSAPGLHSRHARPVVLPDPATHPEELLDGLLRTGRELEEKGILFPCSDAFVLFVSRYRQELGDHFEFCIPSQKVLEGMVNKRMQYDEAVRIGTPIAKTFYPSSMEEVRSIRDSLDYPAFIKPYYSHLWYPVFGNKGFKVESPRELEERYSKIFPTGLEALVQSIIQGPNTNHIKVCAYYNHAGERKAMFLTRKMRQNPAEFGVGTIMESFHDDALAKIGLKFFEGIGYRGIGSIELKLDDRDGNFKMIELNPRLWAQNSQPTYAGINFPLIMYRDLTGAPIPASEYRDGVRWMDTLEDARSFWWYRQRGRTTFSELARSWLNIDCHAHFAWDDPMPAFVHCRGGIEPFFVLADLLKSGRTLTPASKKEAPAASPMWTR